MTTFNDTPSAQRTHIGFFGCCNAGKSSLVNALTAQNLSIVSDVRGTTTDPVHRSMELLPLGPVVIWDTRGLDDAGALGPERTRRTREALERVDIAVLVADGARGLTDADRALLEALKSADRAHVLVWNKCDLPDALPPEGGALPVSAKNGANVDVLKARLAALKPPGEQRLLFEGLVQPGDMVVLVCPIDASAPKGRLILPQQQAVRELLDAGSVALVTQPEALEGLLGRIGAPPKLVVTDSQVFARVARTVPDACPLTSFSILMARYKGFLETAVEGVAAIEALRDGDRVLMAEGCAHHRQCGDIGTVKIPGWLRAHTGRRIEIEACSGNDFPEDLTKYALVIHCGGCMLTEAAVRARARRARAQGVPFTNYGTAIARMTGVLERSLRPFEALHALLL